MELTDRRILVAGGAGFIGSHLVEYLRERGSTVVAADDLSNGSRDRLPETVAVRRVDLSDEWGATQAVDSEQDLIAHLAAWKDANDDDPERQFRENTTITQNLLAAARAAGVTNRRDRRDCFRGIMC